MANKVFLGDDGFIHHVYDGDQTYDIVHKNVLEIKVIVKQLRAQNKLAKVLGDYTKIGHADSGARKAASEALKEQDFDKVALFGTNIFHTITANLIIIASGKGSKIKVFSSKEEAVKWLKK